MGMVNGKTKTIQACIDAQVQLLGLKRRITPILSAIDDAIKEDMADDPLWKMADDCLSVALSLHKAEDIHAEVNKARIAVRRGMDIDYADMKKEEAKSLLIPEENLVDELIEYFRNLCSELEQISK